MNEKINSPSINRCNFKVLRNIYKHDNLKPYMNLTKGEKLRLIKLMSEQLDDDTFDRLKKNKKEFDEYLECNFANLIIREARE